MNQILTSEPPQKRNNSMISSYHQKNHHFPTTKIYRISFLVFSFIAIILLIFLFIRIYRQNAKEGLSKNLSNMYQLSTLYTDNSIYSASYTSVNTSSPKQDPFVIGMIKIDKINLNYPILSESSKELLEISLCRFAGPMPNEVGNLCIAGHNYVDYKLFSRLHEIELDDCINIYDLNGQMIEYIVVKKYETNPNDTSCTTQNTEGDKFITLLTCNNVTQKRLVVIARAKYR